MKKKIMLVVVCLLQKFSYCQQEIAFLSLISPINYSTLHMLSRKPSNAVLNEYNG